MAPAASIRPATPADARAIQRVARDAWHAAYDAVLGADRVDETVDAWYDPERLVADDVAAADRPLFVADRDGAVVGFAEAVPDDESDLAHLYRLYVTPEHWGQGIGSALLARLETVLEDRGFDRLQLSVLAENDVGVRFYEAEGFRRVATSATGPLGVEEYEYRKEL